MADDSPIFRPIIPLALTLAAGIWAGEKFPGYSIWVGAPAIVSAAVLILSLLKGKPLLLPPLLLFCCAGYFSIQPWASPRFPDNHVIHLTDGRPYKISGIIDDTPVTRRHRTRFIMRMTSIMKKGAPFPVSGRIRVTVAGDGVVLAKGDSITFYSKIRSIRNFNNPGAFDYQRAMAFKRVWGRAYTAWERIRIRAPAAGHIKKGVLDRYRLKIAALIDQSIPGESKDSDNNRAVLSALLLGDKSRISNRLRDVFNRTGISHLLAISGLHVGIVAFTVYAVLRWLTGFIPPLLWTGWANKTAALLTLPGVFLYGFLAGMSPSTQRAVIMVSLFLLTFLIDRDQEMINTIAAAALVILTFQPPALFSISFQLSFAAVLSIVTGLSRANGLLPSKRTIPAAIISKGMTMAMATVFATMGTAPLVMAYFNQISLIGLPVNLIMVPLIGFAVVPLGLFAVCVYSVSAAAAAACIKLCGLIVAAGLHMICWVSDWPFAAVKTVTPSIVETGLAYLLMWGLINGWVFRKPSVKRHTGNSALRIRLAKVIFLGAVIGLSIDTVCWLQIRYWHDDLRITVLDVGQGSAALLELPKGPTLLLDGGGFSDNTIFDVGAVILAPFLWRKKIGAIDTMMLSHANSDHYNGLVYIAEHFHVKRVITNGEPARTESFRRFEDLLAAKAIDRPKFQQLARQIFINGVRIELLHPEKDFLQKNRVEAWRNLNNNSLVIKIVYGRHAFLFPGDIMAAGEGALVAAVGKRLGSDVLIAPHHGSASSSSQLFLERVNPETVIVSAGWQNRFNFPGKTVLDRYTAMGCRVYRTDLHGAVQIWTDGAKMKIRTVLQGSQGGQDYGLSRH